MKYRYLVCDVFTDTRFNGNQLAVLPDAAGLSETQMQQIAREFNFSETAFVFPAEQGQTRKVRIFTPTTEVPFAGHPNIGTAFVLTETGGLGSGIVPESVCFEEKAGPVPINISQKPSGQRQFELKAPESLTARPFKGVSIIGDALSLNMDQIIEQNHPPSAASVGLPFLIVELLNTSALADIQINPESFNNLLDEGSPPYILVYTQNTSNADLQARMFAPLDGITEDPATGSANCALAALLAQYSDLTSGDFCWEVLQGLEMGRPSRLKIRAQKENGSVIGSWVAGTCVMVAEGFIESG
ncbi:MAG: PhzF family phenazine biosynthesis protein [Proteobacteria bacterium]|nr:PhzF family phenazine biosynthesis protein [Pseudomonadota bacterium]MBT6348346.1 PhzF family phenazine biosynthesis protein [Pseudomonadota bacterium]